MGFSGSALFSRFKSIYFNCDLITPLLLAVFSGLALFALTSSWPGDTHDGETHIRRVEALTAALQAGVIYPRWLPDLMFGYGKPVLNYYSPGFYYPVALLSFAGLDLISSIRIVLSVGFALSAWWMFRLSRLFASMWPSIVSVICFQFFPYRIYDLFIRGAFPEFSAFIWLPLIAFFTVRAATVDRNDTGRYSHPVLVASAGIAWAGLILTHNLTALMAVLMLGASLALFWALQFRVQAHWLRIFSVGIFSVAIGASLAAWYILPALTELGWVMNGRRLFAGLGMSHLLDWRVLFSWGVVFFYNDAQHGPRLPIFLLPTVLAGLSTVSKKQRPTLRILTLVALPLTLGLAWTMTDSSVLFWNTGERLLDQILFPWRWQIFIAFGASFLLMAFVESLMSKSRVRAALVPLLSLAISVYLIVYATVGLNLETRDSAPQHAHWSNSIEDWLAQAPISPWGQHLLPIWSAGTMLEAAKAGMYPWEQQPGPAPVSTAALTPKRVGLLQQRYTVTTDQPFRLLFHQFYFPAWQVSVNGSQMNVEPATGLGLVSAAIPGGTHDVEIKWGTTPAVWLGRIVTAAGWLVVFVLLCLKNNVLGLLRREHAFGTGWARRFLSPAAWLSVGVILLLGASGITARTWKVTAIAADYGFIRLEGVRPPAPLRAGEMASIQLTWLAKDTGEPVSAFVHLVDESGNGLSQHDGPPGGKDTPYQSWIPGLILYSTHNITIPDSLPPGTYRLVAGLYYPEQAHEPIVPANGSSPRLKIGYVEVIP